MEAFMLMHADDDFYASGPRRRRRPAPLAASPWPPLRDLTDSLQHARPVAGELAGQSARKDGLP